MTTGERMKARRKELGFSAEYVAEKLGVSPATIYRYEKGDIEKMPGNILEPISQILYTTPAYLMGWDESRTVKLDEFLKAFRTANGLSIQEFSSLCGVSTETITKFESCYRSVSGEYFIPSLPTFIKFSSVMNVPLSFIFSVIDASDWIKDGFFTDADSDSYLSPDEIQLVEDYRLLNKEGQEYIRQTMAMAKRSYVRASDPVPDLEAAK